MLPFININKKCQHVLEKDILFGTSVILVLAVKDIILMKISIINVAHVGNNVKRMV